MPKEKYIPDLNTRSFRSIAGTAFVILLLTACRHTTNTADKVSGKPDTSARTQTTQSVQASDPVLGYWNDYDFNDTTRIHQPEVSEQRFVNFIVLLPYLTPDRLTAAVSAMLSKAEKEPTGRVYGHFLELAEKYLYDPNSPMMNDELYIPFVEYVLHDHRTDSLHWIRPSYLLGLLKKNRVGQAAADFEYTLASGRRFRLYAMQAEYTLLFFNNPGCSACGEIKSALADSPLITRLTENGKLKILAVYPDEDLAEWKKHMADMPPAWINAYDRGSTIRNRELYDLKAIPCLYLLDRQKRVILKDAHAGQVINVLGAG